jgi:hypothetical protein
MQQEGLYETEINRRNIIPIIHGSPATLGKRLGPLHMRLGVGTDFTGNLRC